MKKCHYNYYTPELIWIASAFSDEIVFFLALAFLVHQSWKVTSSIARKKLVIELLATISMNKTPLKPIELHFVIKKSKSCGKQFLIHFLNNITHLTNIFSYLWHTNSCVGLTISNMSFDFHSLFETYSAQLTSDMNEI